MSNEQHTPKTNPAGESSTPNDQQPPRSDELSIDDLGEASGGLLPAVGPEK